MTLRQYFNVDLLILKRPTKVICPNLSTNNYNFYL